MKIREALTREEVIQAIERKGGSKIPLVLHKWWGQGLYKKYGKALDEMAADYPDDIFTASINPIPQIQNTGGVIRRITAGPPSIASVKNMSSCPIGMSWISL